MSSENLKRVGSEGITKVNERSGEALQGQMKRVGKH